jgi:outer membrane protein assembly factor BamB
MSTLRAGRCVLVLAAAATTVAADWPQWRGPKRDGVCTETGLLKQWPEGGPKLLWKINTLGRGYATVAITGGRIFTMGDRRVEQRREAQFVIALDLKTHKEAWATQVGRPHRGGGPRCTPTVDGDLLYTVGPHGNLTCLEAATGKIRWQKSFPRDFGGKMSTMWRFSESPLVDGEKVVCTPGGRGAMLAALDKKTGETLWKCAVPDLGRRGRDGAAYASVVVAEACGVRQYVQLVGKGLIGVRAKDGKLLWSYNRVANSTANIPTPIVRDDYVFCTTSYGTGAVLLKLSADGDGVKAEQVYFLGPNVFENIHGGAVLVGDHLYSAKGHKYDHEPICIEFLTGKVVWKAPKALGRLSCTTLYADGHLYHRYENGVMALVEATPDGYRLKSTWRPQSGGRGPTWAHPVVHDGKLYLRHADELACYDVKAQ